MGNCAGKKVNVQKELKSSSKHTSKSEKQSPIAAVKKDDPKDMYKPTVLKTARNPEVFAAIITNWLRKHHIKQWEKNISSIIFDMGGTVQYSTVHTRAPLHRTHPQQKKQAKCAHKFLNNPLSQPRVDRTQQSPFSQPAPSQPVPISSIQRHVLRTNSTQHTHGQNNTPHASHRNSRME